MKEVIELLEKAREIIGESRFYDGSHEAKMDKKIDCPLCLIDQALSLLKPELLTAVCRKCDKPFQTTSDKDRLCPDCQEQPEPSGDTLQKEMIKEAMEAIEQRRPGRAKLVYDKKSRTIIAVPTEQTSGEFVKELNKAIDEVVVAYATDSLEIIEEYAQKLVNISRKAAAHIEQLEEKSAFAVRRIKRDRVRIEHLTERIKELRKWLVKIDHSTHNMLSATRHKSAVRLIEIHDWCEQAMKEEAKDGKPKIH